MYLSEVANIAGERYNEEFKVAVVKMASGTFVVVK